MITRAAIEELLADVAASEAIEFSPELMDAVARLFSSPLDQPHDGEWEDWGVVLKCAQAYHMGRRQGRVDALDVLKEHTP